MGNSRVLNTLVPSKTCRNDVYMVILVVEEIRVEYAIAYLRKKEIGALTGAQWVQNHRLRGYFIA